MQRVTNELIDGMLERLNRALDRPIVPYHKGTDGVYRAQSGNFHIGKAYGGFQLQEMVSDSGGIRTYGGYGTRREIVDRINGMLDGITLVGELGRND